MKLTKRVIDAADPRDGDRVLWDSELLRFGLRLKPSGRKAFVLQYRNAAGRTRRFTLGKYGPMTPTEARKEARRLLAAIDRGEDPSATRREARDAETVKDFAERYLEHYVAPRRKPSTLTEWRRIVERYIVPALGTRRVAELTLAEVHRFHHDLRETPIMANRALAVVSSMLSRAERWGVRPLGSNPCLHVEKYPENKRQRFLDEDELARLGEVLVENEEVLPDAVLALRLLALSGCRKGEVLGLRWEEVDLEAGCLRLEDSKTGAKTVPVGAAVVDLLRRVEPREGQPYVVAGARAGRPLVGLQRIWQRLRAQAGLDDVRLHDLRHTYASVGNELGFPQPILGAILGHSVPGMTARYTHATAPMLQQACTVIATAILSRLNGEQGRILPFDTASPQHRHHQHFG